MKLTPDEESFVDGYAGGKTSNEQQPAAAG